MYSMTKIWVNGFWRARPASSETPPALPRAQRAFLMGPIACLAALTLAIGLWVGPFYDLAERAGNELMNPSNYVEAVLGRADQPNLERIRGAWSEESVPLQPACWP